MNLTKSLIAVLMLLGFQCSNAVAQSKSPVIIDAGKTIAEVHPAMWGVFFEDINFGADGGIYAEMIKNRSFEFSMPLMGWKVQQNKFIEGTVLMLNRQDGNSRNPRFARVSKENAEDSLSLTNEGFRGMGIKKNLRYDFSVLCRIQTPGLKLHLQLLDSSGRAIGGADLLSSGKVGEWTKETASINATETALKGKFRILFEGAGVVDLDMISLFPSDTWKSRPGGMRADMIQLLADMKPGFVAREGVEPETSGL